MCECCSVVERDSGRIVRVTETIRCPRSIPVDVLDVMELEDVLE